MNPRRRLKPLAFLLSLLGLSLLFCTSAFCQLTSVSAVVTDSSSTVWASGTYTIVYQNSTPGQPTISGQSLCSLMSVSCTGAPQVSGTLNSSGQFSVSLGDTHLINPSGATWQFTVCPATSSPVCGTVSIPVTGASQSVTMTASTTTTATISGTTVSGDVIKFGCLAY